MDSVDVLVVGAGIGGLAVSKTYLELAPETRLLILEARSTVGGVWAKEQLYEGIRTNNLVGTYEYSDFPLLGNERYGVQEGEHIPGTVMHQYLQDYAEHFDLHRRIRFHVNVEVIEKLDGGWKLSTFKTDTAGERNERVYLCSKLIICNGLSSSARPVSIPGQERFDRPLFNHGGLRLEAPKVAKDPEVKTVTVIGGSKISYDAVYLFASHGKNVQWIIRESGGGAVWMSTPWIPLPPWGMVMLEHVVTTRFFTWFSPCIWGEFDGFKYIRRFLHGTRLGRWLVHNFWEKTRHDAIDGNGYRKELELKHLEPRESMFWNPRVGIHNYPTDIHDYLRSGQARIHHKDILTLAPNGTIEFTDGSQLETDAIIAVTGWQLDKGIQWKPDGINADLGVPASSLIPKQEMLWADLDSNADQHILNRFPYLRNPPEAKLSFTYNVTPFRLYRGIAPPNLTERGEHSLAFMKMVHCTSISVLAETQALWCFAYLNRKLPVDRRNVYWSTALTSRFGKHRYPWGFAAWWPEFVYDGVPYADMLLTDLGLRRWRKPTMWKEVFEAYTIHDYKGINQEWAQLPKRK